jgi:hypothetical protein
MISSFLLYIIFFRRLLFDATFIVVIFVYTIYLFIIFFKELFKINYLFKNGIETTAFVHKNTYALPIYTYTFKDEIKNGVSYRYNINGEIYESNSRFVETNETKSLKEGSKIIILANPKNKNEAIIKELFNKI